MRKDFSSLDHGGVCVYIKEDIKYELAETLTCCIDNEIIWVKLMPSRSPHGFSHVILAVVYYPGRTSPVESDGQKLLNHLFDSLTAAETMFPNCGLIITGDFNRLNTGRLQCHFKLKQLVKFPTRGDATLDLVLTNLGDHFSTPECFPPFAAFQTIVQLSSSQGKEYPTNTLGSPLPSIRDIRDSNKMCLGRYFSSINWSVVISQPTCEEKLQVFNEAIEIGMSNIMPERTIQVYPKDAPWMSVKLKELIRMGQQAFHANKSGLMYKYYRNAVNKERKRCKAKYYTSKVKDLEGVYQRQWWSEVNKLSGSKKQNSSLFSSLNVPEYNNLSLTEVANSINHALLEPLQPYEPIDSERAALRLPLEENPEFLEVSVQRVYNNLLHLNKHKASGPDGLSNWVLKEYAEILVTPVQNILNASYSEQKLPSMWKIADVIPLPKVKQVTDPKKELRPLSLSSPLSKISEDFIVSDYIKPALESLVDSNQFGTIFGSSTVLALISMIHKWLEATDGNGASVRVLLFDYRKACDLIDHKSLVNKVKQVNIPNSVITG
ncbi:uncharacterized protein [Montipora foliosa]|uniref:uncharacterized protein n=1 Tax=Montipora foliosa TaxID=591990 RepID=UPI0035F1E0D7